MKNKKSSKSTKNAPKRKLASRKSKTPAKTAKVESEEPREKLELSASTSADANHIGTEKSILKSEKPKSKIIKTTTSEVPLSLPNSDNSLKSNKFLKQSKSDSKAAAKISKSINYHPHKESSSKLGSKSKSSYKNSTSKESQTLSSAIEVKLNKSDAVKKSKSYAKKDLWKKDKKLESKISVESNDITIQKEILEKKVKELEKKVAKPVLNEIDKPRVKEEKSSKSSSDKKRVVSEVTVKDTKSRRSKGESKLKNEVCFYI